MKQKCNLFLNPSEQLPQQCNLNDTYSVVRHEFHSITAGDHLYGGITDSEIHCRLDSLVRWHTMWLAQIPPHENKSTEDTLFQPRGDPSYPSYPLWPIDKHCSFFIQPQSVFTFKAGSCMESKAGLHTFSQTCKNISYSLWFIFCLIS